MVYRVSELPIDDSENRLHGPFINISPVEPLSNIYFIDLNMT